MQIINTYESIKKAFPDHTFVMDSWVKYASAISPELMEKCINDAEKYDFDGQVLPILNDALSHPAEMELLSNHFQTVINLLKLNYSKLFDRDIPLDIILYLGLCNGAGQATTLGGRDVILLGMEKIIELQWYDEDGLLALIFHELGHVWHRIYGVISFPTENQTEWSLLQLYQEGIAMVCEHILCGDDNFYHQDKNGWLSWCRQNETVIKEEYLRRLEAAESTQDFFGDWCSYEGHSDVGYFLGCRFVEHLQKKYTLVEISSLSYPILRDEFTRFAAES